MKVVILMGSESDSHRHEAEGFARELARHLEAARAAGRLEALVIVAAPRFLGLLRDELDEPTRRCIRRTIDKSLRGKSPSEIAGHLRSRD